LVTTPGHARLAEDGTAPVQDTTPEEDQESTQAMLHSMRHTPKYAAPLGLTTVSTDPTALTMKPVATDPQRVKKEIQRQRQHPFAQNVGYAIQRLSFTEPENRRTKESAHPGMTAQRQQTSSPSHPAC